MKFTNLNLSGQLQRAIADIGFTEPTPIQAEAIPPALNGQDVIGCAQTGTGKTAAFLLPAFEHLMQANLGKPKPKQARMVVLAPTRELVIQITEQARQFAKHTSISILDVYGGTRMKQQIAKLHRGVDVIIATPGRLLDHIRRKNIFFDDLKILVLDEADRMLDMGFLPDITSIIDTMPRQRQTLLFSATIPPAVLALTRRLQQDPVNIGIAITRPPESINQTLYPVPKHLKTDLLRALIAQIDVTSTLIFTATKRDADVVNRELKKAGLLATCIHGDLRQRHRVAALEGFREGKYQVLVATDIASRGLDIEGISHVINYDTPDNTEDYVHRVGRTARADATGSAITLVTAEDEVYIDRIENFLGYKIDRQTLNDFDYDVPMPSWARPSAKAVRRKTEKSMSEFRRWESMTRNMRR